MSANRTHREDRAIPVETLEQDNTQAPPVAGKRVPLTYRIIRRKAPYQPVPACVPRITSGDTLNNISDLVRGRRHGEDDLLYEFVPQTE